MNTVRRVLTEVKEQRLADDRIEALKKPSDPMWRPLLANLPLVVILFLQPLNRTGSPTWTSIGVGGLALSAAFITWHLVTTLRKRERLWREVIQREAPALHEKLLGRPPH